MFNIYNLSKLRIRADKSMRTLASECGFPTNYISRIEKRKKDLQFEDCIIIAKNLNVSPRWLVDSPVLLTEQSILNLLHKIYMFSDGFEIVDNNGFANFKFKGYCVDILLEIREAAIKYHRNSAEFYQWLYNQSPCNMSDSKEPPVDSNKILINAILEYAREHNISDFSLGVTFGIDEFDASDYVKRIRQGIADIPDKSVVNFLREYDLSELSLVDDFCINSSEDLKHAFFAMYDSEIGNFMISDSLSMRFVDARLSKFFLNEGIDFSQNVLWK